MRTEQEIKEALVACSLVLQCAPSDEATHNLNLAAEILSWCCGLPFSKIEATIIVAKACWDEEAIVIATNKIDEFIAMAATEITE